MLKQIEKIKKLKADLEDLDKKRSKIIDAFRKKESQLEDSYKAEKSKFLKEFYIKVKQIDSSSVDADLEELLKYFEVISETTYLSSDMKEACQPLFDKLIEIEDVKSAAKFLKLRAQLQDYDLDRIKDKKEKYLEKIKQDETPKYTKLAQYTISGPDKSLDAFIRLLARKDLDSETKRISKQTKDYIIDIALGYYGALFQHTYADGEFGVKDFDRYYSMLIYEDECKKFETSLEV